MRPATKRSRICVCTFQLIVTFTLTSHIKLREDRRFGDLPEPVYSVLRESCLPASFSKLLFSLRGVIINLQLGCLQTVEFSPTDRIRFQLLSHCLTQISGQKEE